ncbi:MAG TPA: 2-oxoglutarate dehydrogenase complex dihydrolipoyllysine-residue succinyltransferase [Gemmatimonadaceae bacterium]|nr:2-oxoglutarate dehydrogenase complex dihydrolipoyllysine-residue succinyltransferase [Gemmatimonadaceae bacterium]
MTAIQVPALGESIVEGTIARWLKNEGDAVRKGDALVELETDKINVEVPAPASGVLVKRLKNDGDVVKVGETLGELDEAAVPAAAGASAPSAPAAAKPEAPPAAPAAPAPAREPAATTKTSPSVRRVAAETGIDPAQVPGTGRDGRVTKGDMLAVSASAPAPAASPAPSAPAAPRAPSPPAPSPSPGTAETREKMSTRRKRIAEHLLEAQHKTAHLTTFNEVDMTAVMRLRDRLKERIEKEQGVRLTFMPFFVRAACMALKSYPVINAQVDGDSIVYRHYVHMGIAVASDQGLVVPVIRHADTKGMLQISRDIADVAKRARDGKLSMDDLTGGTFTITNGGVFGSLVSTPILNFPQSGILGLHKIQDRPVAIDGKVEIRPMMYLALSYDHRIVDGQHAVLFLVRMKELLEEPGAMLVD